MLTVAALNVTLRSCVSDEQITKPRDDFDAEPLNQEERNRQSPTKLDRPTLYSKSNQSAASVSVQYDRKWPQILSDLMLTAVVVAFETDDVLQTDFCQEKKYNTEKRKQLGLQFFVSCILFFDWELQIDRRYSHLDQVSLRMALALNLWPVNPSSVLAVFYQQQSMHVMTLSPHLSLAVLKQRH